MQFIRPFCMFCTEGRIFFMVRLLIGQVLFKMMNISLKYVLTLTLEVGTIANRVKTGETALA